MKVWSSQKVYVTSRSLFSFLKTQVLKPKIRRQALVGKRRVSVSPTCMVQVKRAPNIPMQTLPLLLIFPCPLKKIVTQGHAD